MPVTIPSPILEDFGTNGEKLAIFVYPSFLSVYLIDINGQQFFLYRKNKP